MCVTGGFMDTNKHRVKSIFLFVITIITFMIGLIYLATVILLSPLFSLDTSWDNIFELLCDNVGTLMLAIPHYVSSLIFLIDLKGFSKKVSLDDVKSNKYCNVAKKIDIMLIFILTIALIIAFVFIGYYA